MNIGVDDKHYVLLKNKYEIKCKTQIVNIV